MPIKERVKVQSSAWFMYFENSKTYLIKIISLLSISFINICVLYVLVIIKLRETTI